MELQPPNAPTALVALCRWARPLDAEIKELAEQMGEVAYDLRMRLGGPVPIIVGQRLELDQARGLLQILLKRGHGAIAFEADRVLERAGLIRPRRVLLEPGQLVFESDGKPMRSKLDELYCILPATHRSQSESTENVKVKKKSMGRALMTGGMIRHKKKKLAVTQHTDERERVLYLFRRDGIGTVVLHESRLILQGEAVGATRSSNFTALAEGIRAQAAQAIWDQRLVKPRKVEEIDLPPFMRSSEAALDVLAHCLIIAYAQNQIDPE